MRTAYKVRVYPPPGQAAVLNRTFGCVRKVWNQVLEWLTKRYRAGQTPISHVRTGRYLNELKHSPEFAFLCDVSSVPPAGGHPVPA